MPISPRRYDYLVIGAGIYGLAVAIELRRAAPDTSVLVVEAGALGEHSITVNTSGIIRHSYSNPEIHAAASYGLPFFRDPAWALDLPDSLPTFTQVGWARLLNDHLQPGSAEMASAVVDQAHQLGHMDTRVLNPDSFLSQLEPAWQSNVARCFDRNDFTHVVWEADGGWADGAGSLRLFAAAAKRHGVHIEFNARVVDFKRKRNRIVGVQTVDTERRSPAPTTVDSSVVIIAAGLWMRELVALATGLRMPVFPMYHQVVIAHTSRDFPLTMTAIQVAGANVRTIVAMPVVSYWRDCYFRPEGEGILIGMHHNALQSEHYVPHGGELPGGVRVGLDQAMLDELTRSAEHIPLLSEGALRLGAWPGDLSGGHYVMNPEEMPFEGPVPGTDETLYVIGSGCGTGFKLGPGVARLLADRLVGRPRSFQPHGHALSIERAEYFFPPTTPDRDLQLLFEPVTRGGRFRHIGAAGVTSTTVPTR